MKSFQLIIILILGLLISACHKDIEESTTTVSPTPTPKIVQETIGEILGYVYDEDNKAVPNAQVKLYSQTTTTDKYGVFRFKDVKMDKQGTYIKIDKPGYIAGSDFVYPKSGLIYSYTHLYSLDNAYSIQASEGGKIDLVEGGSLVFSANSIVTENGSDYNGKVNITAKRLSTEDPQINDKMPGGLRGEAINGSTVALSSFGMFAVELRSDDGEELQIKEGMTVNIIMPIANSQIENAPAEIPLWYFDEDLGIWKEEGKAILVEGNYEGNVAHFSWWNTDAKFPTIYLCVNVFFENGNPASQYSVSLSRLGGWTTYAYVDGDGSVCGLVPKNEVLELKVISPNCGDVIVEITVGPFDNDVQLDDIFITEPTSLGAGQVECSGTGDGDARVLLMFTNANGDFTVLIPVGDDGSFDLKFGQLACSSITAASLLAYNPITNDASQPIELDINSTNDNIIINICNSCSYTVELIKTLNDPCVSEDFVLEAVVSPEGNYTFLWDNGETTSSISNSNTGTRCVTVNLVGDDCPVNKCIDIDQFYPLGLEFETVIDPYCGYQNGSIFGFINGGQSPYTIEVTGPNGFTSNDLFIENLAEGNYLLSITDAFGCIVQQDTTIVQNRSYSVSIHEFGQGNCTGTTLYARVLGTFNLDNLTYTWSNGQIGGQIVATETGNYCVTVSDGNGCDIDACYEVVEMDTGIIFELELCSDSVFYFYPRSVSPLEVSTETGVLLNWSPNDQVLNFNVLLHGYSFTATTIDQDCFTEYNLPHYEGDIILSSSNTTCSTCNDGHIEIDTNPSANCQDCNTGEIIIFNVSDMNTELSTVNNANELPAGDYIVIMKSFDLNNQNNCFIDHEYVTIE